MTVRLVISENIKIPKESEKDPCDFSKPIDFMGMPFKQQTMETIEEECTSHNAGEVRYRITSKTHSGEFIQYEHGIKYDFGTEEERIDMMMKSAPKKTREKWEKLKANWKEQND